MDSPRSGMHGGGASAAPFAGPTNVIVAAQMDANGRGANGPPRRVLFGLLMLLHVAAAGSPSHSPVQPHQGHARMGDGSKVAFAIPIDKRAESCAGTSLQTRAAALKTDEDGSAVLECQPEVDGTF
eukprot:SAG31_NODE_17870_length_655_cov_0.973022_1_plen_125_part_10